MTEHVERLTAALSERYTLVRELGRGGMATVYLARDLKHDRLVAIKVLRPELAASIGADRFLREIQVTARLSHPHILPLYDSGEAEGFLYYVMPYVEGETLADLLEREKQLSITQSVQIAREVAEGLSLAHSYGLVHRDIKPSNIMLSGGHAVLADFGIARAISEAGGEKLTQTGMAVGTPAYMSPEQAAGEAQLDARSDIYSLGCVLYEMIVGQIPFTGPTPQAIMARHSLDQVPPPHIMRQTIPDDLEDVILAALAKAPADRFHTAADFVDALTNVDTTTAVHRRPSPEATRGGRRRARPLSRQTLLTAGAIVAALAGGVAVWQLGGGGGATAPSSLDPRRIAVLYFDDLSPNRALQHVADGLTEGLIDQLAQVRELRVISRNGVAAFRDAAVSRDSVARALEAGTIVAGSVEPVGADRLRVTTRLIDGASGADFERASFVLPRADLLAVRDSTARDLSRFLRARLGEEIRLRERRAGTTNADAWVLVQRAERARKGAEDRLAHHDGHAAMAAFQQADTLLAAAESADPRWAEPPLLRGQIAYRIARLLQHDAHGAVNRIQTALAHTARALERAPNDPQALELRGTLRYYHWLLGVTPDPRERDRLLQTAKQDLEHAVELDPSLASAHSTLSHLYYQTKDLAGAALAARRAYEEDAYLAVANDVLARRFFASYDLAQFTQAREACAEGRRRFPGDFRFADCHIWLMTAAEGAPEIAAAWRWLAAVDSLTPEERRAAQHHRAEMAVAAVLARAGLADSARRVAIRARGGHDVDPLGELVVIEAFVRTILGERDEAIQLLKRYVAGNPGHAFQRGGDVHWWWRDLRDRPEFRTLLAS